MSPRRKREKVKAKIINYFIDAEMHICFSHFIFSTIRMCLTTDGILVLLKLGISYVIIAVHAKIKSSSIKTFRMEVSGGKDNPRDNSRAFFSPDRKQTYGEVCVCV